MKKLYAVLLFILFSAAANAQPYCNEWIKFQVNQPYSLQWYLKIQVWQEGIHRLTFNDINQFYSTAQRDPRKFQIFHKGVEQYIYVEGESDGNFDSADYIEFYAKPNDGSFDTQLYDSANYQLNPYYSLFNDTSAYFFTIDTTPALGKRMILDTATNFSNYTPANFVMKDVWQEYHSDYFSGYSEVSTDPSYSYGEGYSDGNTFNGSAAYSIPLSVPNVYTGGGSPLSEANTILLGTNTGGAIPYREWTVTVNGLQPQTYLYYGYMLNRYETQFTLTGNTATFLFTPSANTICTCQRNTVPYVRIKYPHTLDFINESSSFQKFTVKPDLTMSKTRLDILNFSSSAWVYVFSGDTIRKVNVDNNSSIYQTLIPTFQMDKECFLTTGSVTNGHSIAPVSTDINHYARFNNFMFANGGTPDYDYLIVYNKSLNANNDVENYKAHRTSLAGGSYKVLLADVDELYDQFAYGINKHPLSIRNFCKLALDNFTPPADSMRYLFLIGKSVRPELSRTGTNYRLNLVPTYGNPPSDMIFTSRYSGTGNFVPAFATGRLPAWNVLDLNAYYDKIIAHDDWLTKDPEEWQKQVLHFGGGNDGTEQDRIKYYLNIYKGIIEDTLFAGHVTSFFKTSTDPIQTNQSAYLQNLIDTGVTIMTFFSHAAGSTFDITTDVPQNYHNKDRYPLIIANSCYIGDIHSGVRQASENFVLLADKGAIGFIASPNTGTIEDQPIYTIPLYQNIASYDYGKSIGECMKDVIDTIPANKILNMGMTLNGDPALQLYHQDKPDLVLTNPALFFTPSTITAELDSFTLNVVSKNIGRAINKNYSVEVIRYFADGVTDTSFYKQLNAMPFVDTLKFNIPMDFARASGLNTFHVTLDAGFSQIDEWREDNNEADIALMIVSSDINPVYPFKYAIIPNGNNVSLKASTANLFAPLAAYRFEIADNDLFSPILNASNNVVNSVGGIVNYTIPFNLTYNKVYYWRVANNAILNDPVNYHWKESSFICIPGKTGWSQAHYSQFKEDEFRNIIYADSMPPDDTTFKFVNIQSSVVCHNSLFPDEVGGHPVDYYINNDLQDYGGCEWNELFLAVIDSVTLKPWTTKDHQYLGNFNKWSDSLQSQTGCPNNRARPELFFAYHGGNATSLNNLAIDLDTNVPTGNYVLLYSLAGGKYSQWTSPLMSALASLGCTIDSTNTQDWQPFIFFTKKGYLSYSSDTVVPDSAHPDITLTALIGGNWDKGFVTSVTIGPSSHWSELHWGQHSLESLTSDSISISVIGIDSAGLETKLIADLPPSIPDSVLSNVIDAHKYPFLKLQAYVQDTAQTTPPQLDRWQIYYDEVPEAALAPNLWFKPNPFTDTIQEGDDVKLEMAIQNISSHDMDSMLVDFYIFDNNHNRINISSPRYRPLPVNDYVVASVSFPSKNYPGLNSLWIEANPHNDQPEQYHFNNLAQLVFEVQRDITNPILDVTFDGQHILDGDIVSAKPFIFIKLKDENKFIALNDTNKYAVYVTDPDGNRSRIHFEGAPAITTDKAKLKWTPAALPDNSFRIEYNPIFPVDGIYQLEVQGSDEAGNLSGSNSYRISFEIINRSTITDFINYPNPFSTATKFVFTLTGSEIPTYLKIQIMTVTGKVIREITQNQIGNIHIGRNITEYAWDGKDEFGDQLANGLYLYRVINRLNGEKIEHRETDADHFFKKGWGKMYLIR